MLKHQTFFLLIIGKNLCENEVQRKLKLIKESERNHDFTNQSHNANMGAGGKKQGGKRKKIELA